MLRSRFAFFTGLLAVAVFVPHAAAQGWGTIKGKAEFDGTPPKPVELKVDKDQAACLAKGAILSEKFVINPKNKGVKWVVVWLAKDDAGKADFTAKLPVHPNLTDVPKGPVTVDQPCCRFEPHVAVVRKGQDFIGKNSSGIAHNMALQGPKGPNVNPLLPAGASHTVTAADWKPNHIPVTMSCGIHGWMKGYVFCFDHPYYAVTDEDGNFEIKNAPAGKYRLIAWQEEMGWAAGDKGKGPGKNGMTITVEDGKTAEVKLAVKAE